MAIIKEMTKEWKVGDITEATVMKIIEVGAIVKVSEFADGLVHISEIAPFRVARVADVLKEGMKVPVKVVGVDKEKGRISFSIKEADRNFIKPPAPPAPPANPSAAPKI
jgi:polyribonucleotide nucleotidyltransferase